MQVTFNIPDGQVQYYVIGTARDFGYSPTLPDGSDNPETKAQFAYRKTAANMRRIARRGLLAEARDAIEVPEIDVTPG